MDRPATTAAACRACHPRFTTETQWRLLSMWAGDRASANVCEHNGRGPAACALSPRVHGFCRELCPRFWAAQRLGAVRTDRRARRGPP
eukprot:4800842-Prymnesium_polylepis.1